MSVITGRVWGYTSEVEWFCRKVDEFVDLAHRSDPDTTIRFERVGPPLFLGTRGFFTKRAMSQQEYKIWLDHTGQFKEVAKYLEQLRDSMS